MDRDRIGFRILEGAMLLFGALLIVFGLPASGYSLPQDLRFEKISIEHGLSQASVLCMLQDSKGFMWLGTYDGLNRYDGNRITVYTNHLGDPHTLSDNGIRSLCEDRSGLLWVGTSNGGLNVYDRSHDTFNHFVNRPGVPKSLSSNEVRVVYEDRRGNIWVGTANGLNRFDRETRTFTRFLCPRDNTNAHEGRNIQAIIEGVDGRLFLGTENGLYILDSKTDRVTDYLHRSGDLAWLGGQSVNCLLMEDRVLWIGLDADGLYRVDLETGQWDHPLQSEIVFSLFIDSRGILWVGTKKGLGRRLDAGTTRTGRRASDFHFYTHNELDPGSLSQNEVHSFCEDQSGILWIGTYSDGVNKLNPIKQAFAVIRHEPWNPDSLSGNHVVSIFEDRQGFLWVGTYNSGLNRVDRKTGICTHFPQDVFHTKGVPGGSVQSVLEDRHGALWIGTQRSGLWKLDNLTGSFVQYLHDPGDPESLSMNNIYFLFEDNDGYLWVGTSRRGLNRLDTKTGKFKRYLHDPDNENSLSNNRIRSIYQCSQGYLWIGTNRGLNRFDRKTENFRHWEYDARNPHSISHNRVTPILEDINGALWVGTDMGLNRFNPQTEIFTRYTTEHGLEDDTIQGLLMDEKGHMWMSTYKGITQLDPETGWIRNYNIEDGLQGTEFWMNACYKSRSGEMFFGGLKGLNAFFAPEIKTNRHKPPVVVTGFKIMNKPAKLLKNITETDKILLSYKDLFFSFEFAVLDYYNPDKNRCAYKLEGFDQDWVDVGKARSATYTNLDQGAFTFRVRGANNDGVWNENGVSVDIFITPPYWKTWWFRLAVLIVVILLVFGFFSFRTRSLRAQKNRLDRLVKERTTKLEDEIAVRRKLEEEREKVIDDLTIALNEVKTLQGFIPICANCKKIRDDEGYWKRVEEYLQDHTDAQFTHGICPECREKLLSELRSSKK